MVIKQNKKTKNKKTKKTNKTAHTIFYVIRGSSGRPKLLLKKFEIRLA
tara:strand:- start:65 stop:208 length:144 start_codon:yes stop_codon:yes gene_type:complete